MPADIDCTLTPGLCVVADPPIRTESRNAFYDTARKLAELGYGSAYLQAHDERGWKTLRVGPISVAALWTVMENENDGPTLARWRPFPHVRGWSQKRSEASGVPEPTPEGQSGKIPSNSLPAEEPA